MGLQRARGQRCRCVRVVAPGRGVRRRESEVARRAPKKVTRAARAPDRRGALGAATGAVNFTDFPRLAQCPAAGALALRGGQKEKPTFPMWRGIFVHRFLEYAVTRGRQAALEYIRSKNMRGLAPWCE